MNEEVIALESSNNAIVGGALLPQILLVIRGDTVTAMLLGGNNDLWNSIRAVTFENNGVLVYIVFIALLLANVFMVILFISGRKDFLKILSMPKHYLYPVIIVFCVVSSIGVNNRILMLVH